jgi:DNA replication protein DnaC
MGMTEGLLHTHLQRLHLPYFADHHTALMAQAGRESWSHGRVLEHLVEAELARRDAALIERRVKAAHLPGVTDRRYGANP